MNDIVAFDSKAFDTAIRAGKGEDMIRQLQARKGVSFVDALGKMKWLPPGLAMDDWDSIAMDVQSELVTVSSGGIPSYLLNYLDPKVIAIVVSPMKAAIIAGEALKGDWTTATAQFITAESVGTVSGYDDYSNDGISNVNVNYPTRQNWLFQSFLRYGELEVDKAGKGKLDWVSQQQAANALVLQKALNFVYFYGVGNLENYGLINDPNLPPSLTAVYPWLTSASATANTIYQDIVRMFILLQGQSNGVLEMDEPMVLAMSPQQEVTLHYITTYNTNSVWELLKQNFPRLRVETAVQYATPSGQLVQLIVESFEGQKTLECCFSSKMRAHQMVVESSAWKQKRSSGAFGTIIYRPFLIASMIA